MRRSSYFIILHPKPWKKCLTVSAWSHEYVFLFFFLICFFHPQLNFKICKHRDQVYLVPHTLSEVWVILKRYQPDEVSCKNFFMPPWALFVNLVNILEWSNSNLIVRRVDWLDWLSYQAISSCLPVFPRWICEGVEEVVICSSWLTSRATSTV